MPNLKQDLAEIDLRPVAKHAIEELTSALEIKTAAGKEFLRLAIANAMLTDRKQQDYGSHNIRKGGVFGCVLRASDKFERLFHLYNQRRKRTVNESIEDSFRDISNYMIIALMIELGRWPNE